MSARSVWSVTISAETITLSLTCDKARATSRRRTVLASMATPCSTRVAKEGAEMVTLYEPGCRSLKRNAPRSSVCASLATPVPVLRAWMVALGIEAPLESVTLPVSDPYRVCAPRWEAVTPRAAKAIRTGRNCKFRQLNCCMSCGPLLNPDREAAGPVFATWLVAPEIIVFVLSSRWPRMPALRCAGGGALSAHAGRHRDFSLLYGPNAHA